MQEVIIILVAISLIDVWVHDVAIPYTTKNYKGYGFKEFIKFALDRKPINCEICLSFWVGLGLADEYFTRNSLALSCLTFIIYSFIIPINLVFFSLRCSISSQTSLPSSVSH